MNFQQIYNLSPTGVLDKATVEQVGRPHRIIRGSGFGLAIVQRGIIRLGGTCGVESAP